MSQDKISKSLNIKLSEGINSSIEKIQEMEKNIQKIDNVDDDYKETRDNLRELIELSKRTLESMLMLADGMESPKAYTVAGELLRTAIDANYRLMELHKLTKDIKKEKADITKANTVNNNSIFVSSTKDIMEMIKQSTQNVKKVENLNNGTDEKQNS